MVVVMVAAVAVPVAMVAMVWWWWWCECVFRYTHLCMHMWRPEEDISLSPSVLFLRRYLSNLKFAIWARLAVNRITDALSCTVLQCWGDSHRQPCQGVQEILTRDGVFAQVVLLCPELPSQFSWVSPLMRPTEAVGLFDSATVHTLLKLTNHSPGSDKHTIL